MSKVLRPSRYALAWLVSSVTNSPTAGSGKGVCQRWTIESDQAQTSEVEVRFYAEAPARTRVELEHRHIDRHGPGWEAVTGGVDGPEGWPLYLDRYAALVKDS